MRFDSGFWNSMAYAIRDTRAAIAALALLVLLLGVLLYGRWLAPEVVEQEVLLVPVIAVERDSDDARWGRVVVETPEDGAIRLLWMDTRGTLRAGTQAQLLVVRYADGTRDYRLLDRP
jgi:hypothetical protein